MEEIEGFMVPRALKGLWDGNKTYPASKPATLNPVSPLGAKGSLMFDAVRKPTRLIPISPRSGNPIDEPNLEDTPEKLVPMINEKPTKKNRKAFSRLTGMMDEDGPPPVAHKAEPSHRIRLRRAMMEGKKNNELVRSPTTTDQEKFPPPNKMAMIYEERALLYQKIADLERMVEEQNTKVEGPAKPNEQDEKQLAQRVKHLENMVQFQQTLQILSKEESDHRQSITDIWKIYSSPIASQIAEYQFRCSIQRLEQSTRHTMTQQEDSQRCLISQRMVFSRIKAAEVVADIKLQLKDLEKREQLARRQLASEAIPKVQVPLLRKQEEVMRFFIARNGMVGMTNLTQQFFMGACGEVGRKQQQWENKRDKAARTLQRLALRFNARRILATREIVADTLEQEENLRWRMAGDEEVERELIETQARQEKKGIDSLLRHRQRQFEARKQKFIDGAWDADPDEDDQVLIRTPRYNRPSTAQKSTDSPTLMLVHTHQYNSNKGKGKEKMGPQPSSSGSNYGNLEEKLLVLNVEEYESRWSIESDEKKEFADMFAEVQETHWEVESVSSSWEMMPIFQNKSGGLQNVENQESANRNVIEQNWFKEYMVLWANCYADEEEAQFVNNRRASVASTESDFGYNGAVSAW